MSQLQNQDPLDPVDSNQFVSQLTEYSQLEQLHRDSSEHDHAGYGCERGNNRWQCHHRHSHYTTDYGSLRTMSIAFSNALSGLTADSTAINVVSENLANLNTTGYKDEQVSFEDLVNQSLSGFSNATSISGSTIAQTTQDFTQGTLQTTGGAFDAAIQGGGFFVVSSEPRGSSFSRGRVTSRSPHPET